MTDNRPRRERRHPAALVHASDHELVLWCPACKTQILRVSGQLTVSALALASIKHNLLTCPAPTSERTINEENQV